MTDVDSQQKELQQRESPTVETGDTIPASYLIVWLH